MDNKVSMFVLKRDGTREIISFDKITTRIQQLAHDLERVKIHVIALKTINNIYDGISTSELDTVSANICATLASTDYEYNKLGGRIAVSSAEKNIAVLLGSNNNFVGRMNYIQQNYNALYGRNYLVPEMLAYMNANADYLNGLINYENNYTFEFFGYKTLEKSYLMKFNDKPVDTPQDLFLRVAVSIHFQKDSKDLIEKTYNYISAGYFTHATPTLFNAGVINGQYASCFLLGTDDSIEGMYKNVSDCAMISKGAGGIGVHVSNIRAKNSIIKGSNGRSNGIVRLLRVLNETSKHVTQGGKRAGSFAIYLEPWHADVKDFLELKKQTGAESERCRDLFLALWIPDLFMKAVQENDDWYLMSPDECPNLNETYGKEFEDLYNKYVSEGKYREKVKAIDIWERTLVSQIETGVPYILYKDRVNERSNQKNIGVVKSSNLCAEITEVSDINTHSVCNLASIGVNKFYIDGVYDFDKLKDVAKLATINLNRVIDVNAYPTKESEATNLSHRPIGVGIQGLADLFCQMKLPFDSQQAVDIDAKIMETIYYGCLEASAELAVIEGSYPKFEGSDFQKGILQFDYSTSTTTLDWASLREKVKSGMRNSLLTALMPTASTSQIMGNCECFEPYSSNLFVRKTLAGEYTVVNEHLVKDLIDLGLWNKEMFEEILYFNGSIQKIKDIPQNIKNIYKTAFELKGKDIVQQSIERGPFIDQTQSMNLFQAIPDFNKLSASHFYGWKNGLKTGMYYLRTQPVVDPIKFGLDPSSIQRIKNKYSDKGEMDVCKWRPGMKRPEGCDVCSA